MKKNGTKFPGVQVYLRISSFGLHELGLCRTIDSSELLELISFGCSTPNYALNCVLMCKFMTVYSQRDSP